MTNSQTKPFPGRWQPKAGFDLGILLALGLLTVACAWAADSTNRATSATKPVPTNASSSASSASLEEQWGIQVASLRLVAEGNMIDFRYRVTDPDKGAPLANRKIKAYLIDQTSGLKFGVPSPPKVGAMRQNTLKLTKGRIYFMLFGNPGQVIKAGSKVTVVVGDFRAENLIVE